MAGVSVTPKITLQLKHGPEFCPCNDRTFRGHMQIIRITLATLALHTAREPQTMTHTIVSTSARTYPNRPRSCTAAQDITSGRIRRAQ